MAFDQQQDLEPSDALQEELHQQNEEPAQPAAAAANEAEAGADLTDSLADPLRKIKSHAPEIAPTKTPP